MKNYPKLRDFIFRVRYRFQGVPFSVGDYIIRLDESLRRWNVGGEAAVQNVLMTHLKPGDCVLDIGANFGMHTILSGRIVGEEGEVHAFEPLESNLKLLRRHVAINRLKNVKVVPSAVSNSTADELTFFSGADDYSVTASLQPSQENMKIQKVPNLRLDDYSGIGSRNVRLIKIDVEGAELDVLRGAEKLIRRHKPILVIEVHAFAFPSFGTSLDAFRQFLGSLGYIEQILPETVIRNGLHYQGIYSPAG